MNDMSETPRVPGYWMHETSGALAPVIRAYLCETRAMTPAEVGFMRAYLRQWIMAPVWLGPGVEMLRLTVGTLDRREAFARWLDEALELGIDPL